MPVERFANLVATPASDADDNGLVALLSAAISTAPAAGTVESWAVDRAAPAGLRSGQFRARVDNEVVLVDAGATGTSPWSVTRGAEGSTPATHANGAKIRHYLTAGSLRAIMPHDTEPRMHKYASWSFDPVHEGGAVQPTNGALYYYKLPIVESFSCVGIDVYVEVAGATFTQAGLALYNEACDTLLAESADLSAVFNTNGLKQVSIGPVTLPNGQDEMVYAALLLTATTRPTFRRCVNNVAAAATNANLASGDGFRIGRKDSVGTAFPANPGRPPTADTFLTWVGLRAA